MKKLLWIDLEMTGLDVTKEVILEVGAVVTNKNLDSLDTYHSIIHQPQSYLEAMDEWNKTHHKESGLLDQLSEGKSQERVENELIEWTSKHFRNERAILCGNSILQDRIFIDKYFSRFSKYLHYRMLDVTSWKLVFHHFYQFQYKKKVAHRALEDIRESIEEMKTYLKCVQTPRAIQ